MRDLDATPPPLPISALPPNGRKDALGLRDRPTQGFSPPRKFWRQRLGRCCLAVAQMCQPRHGSGVQKLNERGSETKQLSAPQFARPACAS